MASLPTSYCVCRHLLIRVYEVFRFCETVKKETSGKALPPCRFKREQKVICAEVNNIRVIIWPIKGSGSSRYSHVWQNELSLRRKLVRLRVNSSLLFTSPRGSFTLYYRNSYRNRNGYILCWMMGQGGLIQPSGSLRCLMFDASFIGWSEFPGLTHFMVWVSFKLLYRLFQVNWFNTV